LRRINVFEPQRYSHQISGLTVEQIDERSVRCRSNYLVVRTGWMVR
jgi:3-phenylpropionate/cinnamic acid dioxygenase small subunit